MFGLEVVCAGVELDAPAWAFAEVGLDTMAVSLRCYDGLSEPIVVPAALLRDFVVSIETVLKLQRKPPSIVVTFEVVVQRSFPNLSGLVQLSAYTTILWMS